MIISFLHVKFVIIGYQQQHNQIIHTVVYFKKYVTLIFLSI